MSDVQPPPPHPAWVDDERAPHSCSPIVSTATVPNRPLWQDVLWGRELGHGTLFEAGRLQNRALTCDTSLYVDLEFDSGQGSPAPEGATL